jgi:hypothetical protein
VLDARLVHTQRPIARTDYGVLRKIYDARLATRYSGVRTTPGRSTIPGTVTNLQKSHNLTILPYHKYGVQRRLLLTVCSLFCTEYSVFCTEYFLYWMHWSTGISWCSWLILLLAALTGTHDAFFLGLCGGPFPMEHFSMCSFALR